MTVSRYSTPLAFKQALEARVRGWASERGSDMNRVRQLIVFDRFLVRVFATLGDRVVLKGGAALELRLERARTTKDVDLRLTGSPSEVLDLLRTAAQLDMRDYLQFEVRPDPTHPDLTSPGMKYGGKRFRALGRLAGKPYGHAFGVDVAFADPLSAAPDELASSALLDFAGASRGRLRIYPLADHLAEKLHAYTMPRPRPNTRVKDLPDLALLANVRAMTAHEVRRALDRTFVHRTTHPIPTSLPAPPSSWREPYARMARLDALPWPDLDVVYEAARRFVDPVLAGSAGSWDPRAQSWSA